MQVFARNITRKVFSYLLITIIGVIIVNKAFYMHTHQLPNGKIVLHAHPFNKTTDDDPLNKHSHNDAELQIIHQLDLIFVFTFLAFTIPLLLKQHILFGYCKDEYSIRFNRIKRGRAPPAK